MFVVDEKHHPVGTCALSWVLRAPRSIPLADVMKRDQTLVPVTLDQEEVGLMFQKYNLISAAVVDENERLVGQMTVDDVVHIISEEAGEDALLMSGAGEGDINEPIREAYSARVRWLVANLGTALVASVIIALFGAAIEKLVALAVLMPIVASIGGNAGTLGKIRRQAKQVHHQDRPGPRCDPPPGVVRVDVPTLLVHVAQNRRRAARENRVHTPDKRECGKQHLIAGPDTERGEYDRDPRRSGGDGTRVTL